MLRASAQKLLGPSPVSLSLEKPGKIAKIGCVVGMFLADGLLANSQGFREAFFSPG